MVTSFGRLPPALRSYVKHIIVFDGTEGDGEVHTHAGTVSDGIMFFGNSSDSVFMHEAAHCIDREFHDNPLWTDAKAKDTCVPSFYARSSDTELFAEVSGTYIYDKNSESLKERGYDPSCMANLLQAVGDYVGKEYTLGTSKCIAREPNTPIVTPDKSRIANVEPYISEVDLEDFDSAGVEARDDNTRWF